MRSLIVEKLQQWQLPGWLVPDFFFMLTIALLSASALTLWFWQRSGQENRTASDLLFWGIPGLFVGARLLYIVQYGIPDHLSDLWLGGGFGLYGGLVGILSTWAIYSWFRPYPAGVFLDAATPGLALGLFFGRIGCFLAGCNGGTTCDLPWATSFPRPTPVFQNQAEAGLIDPNALLSLPVHPTQLYEALFGVVAFFLLVRLWKVRTWPGQVFSIGLLWYATYRFSSEWLRADAGGWHPLGALSFSQFLSIIVALIAAGKLWTERHSAQPPGESVSGA